MNARILELLQRPENISKEDISLLEKEISKFPYMQSIRTLQLFAVHNFSSENYHKELTKTAAYTTDKKILYQFINYNNDAEKKESRKFKKINLAKIETTENQSFSEINSVVASEEKYEGISLVQDTEITEISAEKQVTSLQKNIIGDTELETPILNKKENEFNVFKELQTIENQKYEDEKTIEKKPEIVFKTREEDLNFTKDKILDFREKITAEKDINPSDISFNGFDSFLPDVKFTIPSAKKTEAIVEVSSQKTNDEKSENNDEVSFEKIQNFEVSKPQIIEISEPIYQNFLKQTEIEEPKIEPENLKISVEKKSDVEDEKVEIILEPETHIDWKPMNFMMNPLDSTLKKEKTEEIKNHIVEVVSVELEKQATENIPENENKLSEILEITQEHQQSNIPNFVNTWQNWLKIDRKEGPKSETTIETQTEKIIEKKAEIIDKFIEENPKISQFKEDASYVVKEKAEDISHLMTETLAKLYTTQKLYSKAISAYEILMKKYPEKAEEFLQKINKIKDSKQGK